MSCQRALIGAFSSVTHMRRGVFLTPTPHGGLHPRVRVGTFEAAERTAVERLATEFLDGSSLGIHTEWIPDVGAHSLTRRVADALPDVASAVVLLLRGDGLRTSVVYLDSNERLPRPPGGELRALEYLASEAVSLLRRTQERTARNAEAGQRDAENERIRFLLGQRSAVDAIIGVSPAAVALREQISRVADSPAPVSVAGPPGSGRAFVGRVLHFAGARARGPFVRLACETLDERSLRHALFGEGPDGGRVRAARGGTLLLESVDTLPPALQQELDTILSDGEVADVRWVASSVRPLEGLAQSGAFSPSLCARLGVVSIQLPPLAERGEDVLLLADHFLSELAVRHGKPQPTLAEDARRRLLRYEWPGNVRELRDRLERALVLSDHDGTLDGGVFEGLVTGAPAGQHALVGTFKEQLDAHERLVVERALVWQGWNISRTAKRLEISRQHLHNLIKKHGLSRTTAQ